EQNRSILQAIEADLKQNELQSVKQREELNDFKLKKERTSEQLDMERASRSVLVKKLEDGESETKEQRVGLKAVEEQLRQTEIQANRLDVELDNILHKLSDEYELSFELAKQRYAVPEDVPQTQAEVKELK